MAAGRRTHWGWHQLTDEHVAELVAGADIAPGELVLDVGAGEGAITASLLRAGARVVAVELHPRRAAGLRRRFAGQPVVVVQADAADLRLPRRPFKAVANPPFAITTALLRRLLSPGSRLIAAQLVVPRPVAARWAAGRAPGARRWQPSFDVRVERCLPRSAVRPPAPSAIAVLSVGRRPGSRS